MATDTFSVKLPVAINLDCGDDENGEPIVVAFAVKDLIETRSVGDFVAVLVHFMEKWIRAPRANKKNGELRAVWQAACAEKLATLVAEGIESVTRGEVSEFVKLAKFRAAGSWAKVGRGQKLNGLTKSEFDKLTEAQMRAWLGEAKSAKLDAELAAPQDDFLA